MSHFRVAIIADLKVKKKIKSLLLWCFLRNYLESFSYLDLYSNYCNKILLKNYKIHSDISLINQNLLRHFAIKRKNVSVCALFVSKISKFSCAIFRNGS